MANLSDFANTHELLKAAAEADLSDRFDMTGLFDQMLDRKHVGRDRIPFPTGGRVAAASFETKGFPAADILIYQVKGGFQIEVAGKPRGPVMKRITEARINAEELHKRLVAALEADMRDRMPTFGRF